jgi:outer membrane protein
VSAFLANHASCYGQVKMLSFEDAVKIAVRNNVLLNQQMNNLQYSQMQKLQSIVAIAPNVSLTSTASQFNGNSFNNNTGKVVNGVRDNLSGSVNANINLFSGFNRFNQIRQYSNQLDAQSYFVNRTGQDVINTVGTQYLTVMLDVELLKIARENFVALDKQYNQVKEQVSLGARSPVDEYNQDALAKAAELRMVQAEINLNNDKTVLTQTLLIDPFEQYEVEKPGWDVNAFGYDSLDIHELAEKAKLHRGDYLRAVKNEEAFRFSTKAARGLMMPSLYAFANYGSAYNRQHDVPDSLNRPFNEQFRTNNVYKQYGFQLQIPVFNGLQNRTTLMQQKVLYENSQWTRKNLEYQIKNDVIRAVRNYEGVKKAFIVSIDQLKAADLAFQLETERYNLGVTNFVDFTNANRVLVQAQTDKAQAEYRLVFQRILIEYAVGTLKAEDFQQ